VDSVIGAPGRGFPAPETQARASFWERFEAAAPWPLKAGWTAALAADAVGAPLAGPLRDVARIVACMAYFDADEVQAHVRTRLGR